MFLLSASAGSTCAVICYVLLVLVSAISNFTYFSDVILIPVTFTVVSVLKLELPDVELSQPKVRNIVKIKIIGKYFFIYPPLFQ